MWNDAGRWWFWWNVGKLLQVNETTSLTLECRAFTVRFFTRDRSSLRQRMTFYLCSSHLEVEILTPRFLDDSTMTLMFFVLMVDIWHSIKFPECCHWAFVLFAIQFGIQSDTEERCDYDFFWREPHEPQEWSSLTSWVYSHRSIGVQKIGWSTHIWVQALQIEISEMIFSPFLHPSNFGPFKGMTRL